MAKRGKSVPASPVVLVVLMYGGTVGTDAVSFFSFASRETAEQVGHWLETQMPPGPPGESPAGGLSWTIVEDV